MSRRTIKSPPRPRPVSMMTGEQKNEALLQFAGFTRILHPNTAQHILGVKWLGPDGKTFDEDLPDLLHSRDAQDKWVLPKLQDMGLSIKVVAHEHKGVSVFLTDVVHSDAEQIYRHGDMPAEVTREAILAWIGTKAKV